MATTRGELTRQAILDHAAGLAAQIGLEGLSIGRLAEDLKLSKSGLFAHFKSKEALQVQVLETTRQQFVDRVVKPGLTAPRGEPRLRALFDNWLAWGRGNAGGCLFVNTAIEFDDRPGPVRDLLVQNQRDWLDLLANTVRAGAREGHFDPELDPDQLAHELYGIMLGWTHAARLLRDPKVEERTRFAFEALLDRYRRK
ncbi:MAG TPA: TetR/AcrR family transcriptional regulator [Thermoanaerobaculia bacterium]|jgi:AcrR family transcriptional regulator|nr:TetR/AcrR family transcriptional regulator [Thermoanaerobaculia bacterium]